MKIRQTAQQSEWINAHESPPPNGAQVLALTRGSKLIECVWTKDSINSCDAWAPYLKIPTDVRAVQQARWTPEEFKGETNERAN